MRLRLALLVALALFAACGSHSGSSSTTTGGGGGDLHEPWPQVPNQGGPILAHPGLVTITFDNDANQATLESFGDWVVSSAWLTAVGADYGVASGTHVKKVRVTTSPPGAMSTNDVQSLFAELLANGTAPTPASGMVYLMYMPSTTTVTDPVLGTSCQDFAGYHTEISSDGRAAFDVAYGAVMACPSDAGIAFEEETASHEFIESATDPYPDDAPGWLVTDMSSPFAVEGGEVADLCLGNTTAEGSFSAQRIYSNTAAKLGGSPCIPAVSGAYLGFSATPATVQTAAAGTTLSFTVSAWGSDATTTGAVAFEIYGDFDPHPTVGEQNLAAGQQTQLHLTIPPGTASGDVLLLGLHAETTADTNDWAMTLVAQ